MSAERLRKRALTPGAPASLLMALAFSAALPVMSAAQGAGGAPGVGEGAVEFRAHLSLVPVDGPGANRTSGMGEAQGTLSGRTLSIAGSFRALASAVAGAELREGAPGFRGPPFHALTVSGEREGALEGRIELTEEQLRSLARGHLYIQVYTETNPDGAIRGWLFPTGG
jgi:hypothetical protein